MMRRWMVTLSLVVLITAPAVWAASASPPAYDVDGDGYDDIHAYRRELMIKEQISSREISDPRVLEAMGTVERHLFVPETLADFAYTDQPIPIGYQQTISQPYIVAFMTQTLGLDGNDKVLEIGTGSGYQAAILAEIVDQVYTIEVIAPLALEAKTRLKSLGYSNISVKNGNGYEGWPELAPFDAIIVTAASKDIPGKLVEQLKVSGKMVIPVGRFEQELLLVTKTNEGIEKKTLLPVHFVPMVHSDS
jgi:protein-L-isoaspartate(D-aspartate) O-methyltransferase